MFNPTTLQKGPCGKNVIQVNRWQQGYSLKCYSGNQTNEQKISPLPEANLPEKLCGFCTGCLQIKEQN